jgi:hypothetical protein
MAIHRMVLQAFVGECPDGMECCHNNSNPSDNRLENLRWDTHINNNGDRKRAGNYAVGSNHHQAKLSREDVLEIRSSSLSCRELGEIYGIAKTHAWKIRRREVWTHI